MAEEHRAFTRTFDGLANVLVTPVGISLPSATIQEALEKNLKIETFQAIWDTGATNSVVTEEIVQDLGLISTGKVECRHVGGTSTVDSYLVNLILPNEVAILALKVTVGILPTPRSILVGMDVINRGDFAVTHVGGITKMSFRMPSCKTIDFVPDSQQHNFVLKNGTQKEKNRLGIQ